MNPKIEITIDKKTGDIKIETDGFEGNSCEDLQNFFSKKLGVVLNSTDKRGEQKQRTTLK